jgi:enhancing lycopene biosynthesis protein 2
MTSLSDQLAAMRLGAFGDGTKPGRIPPDVAAVMHRVTADQRASGYRTRMPAIGTAMPGFRLADTTGTDIDSVDLLARGPLVVSFFRGAW